jgi:hypothetical protein
MVVETKKMRILGETKKMRILGPTREEEQKEGEHHIMKLFVKYY